jgi:hypothetical protein
MVSASTVDLIGYWKPLGNYAWWASAKISTASHRKNWRKTALFQSGAKRLLNECAPVRALL